MNQFKKNQAPFKNQGGNKIRIHISIVFKNLNRDHLSFQGVI